MQSDINREVKINRDKEIDIYIARASEEKGIDIYWSNVAFICCVSSHGLVSNLYALKWRDYMLVISIAVETGNVKKYTKYMSRTILLDSTVSNF